MKKTKTLEPMCARVAIGVLQDCLEEGTVIPSNHFREELSKECLDFEDAWHVMKTGQIYDEPERDMKTGEEKFRVEGFETGGKWLVIVFCFKQIDLVLLITAFFVKGRRR